MKGKYAQRQDDEIHGTHVADGGIISSASSLASGASASASSAVLEASKSAASVWSQVGASYSSV